MRVKIISTVNQSEGLTDKIYTADGYTTKWGICYEIHQEWLNSKGVFSAQEITREIKELFDSEVFYNPMKINHIKDIDLAYNVYDMGYNSGKSTAIEILQECINLYIDKNHGLKVDGLIGRNTLSKLNLLINCDTQYSLCDMYIKARKAKYIDVLKSYRESKKYTDKHLMNCLVSWNRRCRRIA
ncbi:hypothetical protein MJH12_14220 [bacterium]|nr:hypothetical protein [bacterium]